MSMAEVTLKEEGIMSSSNTPSLNGESENSRNAQERSVQPQRAELTVLGKPELDGWAGVIEVVAHHCCSVSGKGPQR